MDDLDIIVLMSSNIDQSLLASNLELSPTERLEQHQHALDLLLEIDKAKDILNEQPK